MMIGQRYGVSVEAEYYAKVGISAELSLEHATTEDVKREFEKHLTSGIKSTRTVDNGHVAILLAKGTLMRAPETGRTWVFTTTDPRYVVHKIEDANDVALGSFDLTGALAGQVLSLKAHKTSRYGFDYYQ
jgi:hypothetical protein